MNVVLVLVLVAGLSLAKAEETSKVKVKVQGDTFNTTDILLQVSGPIELSVFDQAAGAKTLFGKGLLKGQSEVTGKTSHPTEKETKNTLTIKYKESIELKKQDGSSAGSLNDVQLTIITTLYSNISYWKISDMTVSYSGDKTAQDEALWVDKVPGFLKKGMANWNCQRGYTSCAPKDLSWSCDQQTFTSKKLDDKKGTVQGSELVYPGMQIQPLYAKGKIRFGYNWDCDPLISSPLWVSLLIGLALIFAIFWSCDMITSLNTPDKFDDAKKTKPIQVDAKE